MSRDNPTDQPTGSGMFDLWTGRELPIPNDRRYAVVNWQIGDVKELFDLTDVEAHEFLQRNSPAIQDRLIELGWSLLGDLGSYEGLHRIQEDEL